MMRSLKRVFIFMTKVFDLQKISLKCHFSMSQRNIQDTPNGLLFPPIARKIYSVFFFFQHIYHSAERGERERKKKSANLTINY